MVSVNATVSGVVAHALHGVCRRGLRVSPGVVGRRGNRGAYVPRVRCVVPIGRIIRPYHPSACHAPGGLQKARTGKSAKRWQTPPCFDLFFACFVVFLAVSLTLFYSSLGTDEVFGPPLSCVFEPSYVLKLALLDPIHFYSLRPPNSGRLCSPSTRAQQLHFRRLGRLALTASSQYRHLLHYSHDYCTVYKYDH